MNDRKKKRQYSIGRELFASFRRWIPCRRAKSMSNEFLLDLIWKSQNVTQFLENKSQNVELTVESQWLNSLPLRSELLTTRRWLWRFRRRNTNKTDLKVQFVLFIMRKNFFNWLGIFVSFISLDVLNNTAVTCSSVFLV